MLLTAAFKLVLPPAVAKLNEAIPTPLKGKIPKTPFCCRNLQINIF